MTDKAITSMDIHEILNHLPHRYPFMLVDRVLSLEVGKEIVAVKNVSMNEPFFPGHFPYHPVMPGVLIVEAMAQAAAILSFKTMETKPSDDSVYYFAGIDFKCVCESIVVEDHVEFACINAQTILIADVHGDGAVLLEIADVLIDECQR